MESLRVFLLLLIFISSQGSFSNDGVGEGGGHDYEGRFKAKLESILDDILEMSDASRDKLDFDYRSLASIVKLELLVLCANEAQEEKISNLGKMAYVFKGKPREIVLDCSEGEDVRLKWYGKFESEDIFGHIFFIHEALRAQNILNDDNYVFSGSYINAYQLDQSQLHKDLLVLYHTRNQDCVVDFSRSQRGFIFLKKKRKDIYSYQIKNSSSVINLQQALLDSEEGELSRVKRRLIRQARQKKCFLYSKERELNNYPI